MDGEDTVSKFGCVRQAEVSACGDNAHALLCVLNAHLCALEGDDGHGRMTVTSFSVSNLFDWVASLAVA